VTDPTAPAIATTQRFYDRLSRVYDLLADRSEHASREAGLALLAVASGEAVLEIGCGTGHALVDLARAVGPDGHVVGVDLSPGMLAVARRRVAGAEVGDRVALDLGDARALPYADGAFAAVFLSFTLELFEPPDLGRVLAEIRRVLRPGGRLGVVSLDGAGSPGTMVELYRWLHRHFPHFIDCQPIHVRGHLTAAGFAVSAARELSIWGLPVVAAVAEAEAGELRDALMQL
jgi:ubiquinone/menaquinone biosynthesis C-methylase UbiE